MKLAFNSKTTNKKDLLTNLWNFVFFFEYQIYYKLLKIINFKLNKMKLLLGQY